jgi:hypothetical protein
LLAAKRRVLQVFGCEEYFDLLTIQALELPFFELFGARQVADVLGVIGHFGRGCYPRIVDVLEVAIETVPIEFLGRHYPSTRS